VAAGGFITFPFVVDNVAKCVKETAQPGQEREGASKVSSAPPAWPGMGGTGRGSRASLPH
jgi:hypothetical protein